MYPISAMISRMEGRAFCLFIMLLLAITPVKADFFVQTLDCSRDLKLIEKHMKTNNEEKIMSQSRESLSNNYYESNCDNALAIIGKNDYQFEVELAWIIMRPPNEEGYCTDYLQLYDAPRVDNAMLLTPLNGLCGSSMPLKKVFKTSKNYLTIRLKTGESDGTRFEGFAILIRQNRWSSPGNNKVVGFNPGGWNDGLSSSFQWTWNLQVRVPGSLRRPGQDLEKSPNGIDCVECNGCSVHEFDLDRDAYATSKGCFMCAKIWNADYSSGQRSCYSERGFLNLLKSFGEPRIDLSTRDGLFQQIGCHQYYEPSGTKLNYCFCNEAKCNTATRITNSLPVVAIIFVSSLLNLLL